MRRPLFIAGILMICSSAIAAEQKTSVKEAERLVDRVLEREALVLKGARWEWSREIANCNSPEKAMRGQFNNTRLIDRYDCRWLTNEGNYLLETMAKQPIRPTGDAQQPNVVTTTLGSEIFLQSKESRLSYVTASHSQIQSRKRGLRTDRPWGGIPIHAGAFALGRIGIISDELADPANTVTVENGENRIGDRCTVVMVHGSSKSRNVYYFRTSDSLLTEVRRYVSEDLSSCYIVLKSHLVAIGDVSIELPWNFVSFSRVDEQWRTWNCRTHVLELSPVADDEMVVDLGNVPVEVFPYNRLQETGSIEQVSAENLDEVVEMLFSNFESRTLKKR